MIEKALSEIEREEIKEILEAMEIATFQDIDNSIKIYGKQIVQAYRYGLISPNQKAKLSEYRKAKEQQSNEVEDKKLIDKMIVLENSGYIESPGIYQYGLMHGRIIIASVETVMDGKIEKQRTNGGKDNFIEIFQSKHPRAYEYAKKNYQIAEKLI